MYSTEPHESRYCTYKWSAQYSRVTSRARPQGMSRWICHDGGTSMNGRKSRTPRINSTCHSGMTEERVGKSTRAPGQTLQMQWLASGNCYRGFDCYREGSCALGPAAASVRISGTQRMKWTGQPARPCLRVPLCHEGLAQS
jgi:hypothetical protein